MARNRDLASIMRAFDAIPKSARKPISGAIEKGARELVGRMRYLAPKDDGDLQGSIKFRMTSDVSAEVFAGGEPTTRPVREGVSATFDYAIGQEHGTSEMPASPYFWPSVRTLGKKVRRRVDRSIAKAVKDTWGKK